MTLRLIKTINSTRFYAYLTISCFSLLPHLLTPTYGTEILEQTEKQQATLTSFKKVLLEVEQIHTRVNKADDNLDCDTLHSLRTDPRKWANKNLAVFKYAVHTESIHFPCVTEEMKTIHKSNYPDYELDFSGEIYVPPTEDMWNFYQQHLLKSFTFDELNHDIKNLVVFGTKDDQYTKFPQKYGTLSRKEIIFPESKKEEIESYLQSLNPNRALRKRLFLKVDLHTQSRLHEIAEESGMRIEYAPAILMINRFIKSKEDFFKSYLSGARGIFRNHSGKQLYPKDYSFNSSLRPAQPDFITDHELYRMFSSPHCSNILKDTVFADGDTEFKILDKRKVIIKDENPER